MILTVEACLVVGLEVGLKVDLSLGLILISAICAVGRRVWGWWG